MAKWGQGEDVLNIRSPKASMEATSAPPPATIGAMLSVLLVACIVAIDSGEDSSPGLRAWQVVGENLPAAALSVWGNSADEVWIVGADTGTGPSVLHLEGGI